MEKTSDDSETIENIHEPKFVKVVLSERTLHFHFRRWNGPWATPSQRNCSTRPKRWWRSGRARRKWSPTRRSGRGGRSGSMARRSAPLSWLSSRGMEVSICRWAVPYEKNKIERRFLVWITWEMIFFTRTWLSPKSDNFPVPSVP